MIYTLTLNPAVDYRLTLPRLTLDATNVAVDASASFGGKGINVSLVLASLSVESVALGFVAGFTGDALAAHLEERGLSTDFIRLPAGMTRINVKLWGEDAETEINAPGPFVPPDAMEALEARLLRLSEGDTLVMAGRLPAGLPADTYARLTEQLTPRGVRVVVDATGETLRRVLPLKPFLVKPNLAELEELIGRTLRGEDGSPSLSAVAEAAAELRTAGAQNVLVTLGKYGAYLLDDTEGSHHLPAPRGVVVGTVGAGDSTVAGFLAGMARGWDPASVLRLAVAAGSATAMSEGLATGELIERVLAGIKTS